MDGKMREWHASSKVVYFFKRPHLNPSLRLVYINQASPAVDSIQNMEILNARIKEFTVNHEGSNKPLPVPLVLSIGSRGDTPTRVFFPIGQVFSLARNSLRKYPSNHPFQIRSQRELFYQTTANAKKLHSHVIGNANSAEIQAAQNAGGNAWLEYMDRSGVCFKLVPLPGAINTTPYWISQLPVEIVPDHNTIFTAAFVEFLSHVLLRASTYPFPPTTCAVQAALMAPPPPEAAALSAPPRPSPRNIVKR